MKKILAIILTLTMLLSAFTVMASAAGEQIITPYEKVEVTASVSLNPVLKFVPEETRTYIVKSFADDSVDPYCYIESENGDMYAEFDDSTSDCNFSQEFEFEAGVVYYITIFTYSEEESTFEFALECPHMWDDDTCVNCSKVCDHDTTGKLFDTCDCGTNSLCKEIKLGETLTVACDEAKSFFVKFIPEEDTVAMLRSYVDTDENDYDVAATIFNSDGEELIYNDDFGATFDFFIWYEFTAGETYYFEITSFYDGLDVVFALEKPVHTTEDGEEHTLVYKSETIGTYHEYTVYEGAYCEECGEYIIGGELMEVVTGHYDDDDDGYCDECGEEYVEDSDDNFEDDDYEDDDTDGGIFQFFYNIILYIKVFFQILFSIFM